MTKEKNEKKSTKDHWSSLSLDLDSGELDLDAAAKAPEEEVKKRKRGRPKKVQTEAQAEKPARKTTRKRAVKTEDTPLIANTLFAKKDESLDFAIGAVPVEKPTRGRKKKAAPKRQDSSAQPTEQIELIPDPWSSLVSQLDGKASRASETVSEKPRNAFVPLAEVPSLNAPDFSLEDFFATDEQLEISWGKKADDLESVSQDSFAKESADKGSDKALAPREESEPAEKKSFGFTSKEKTSGSQRDTDSVRSDSARGQDSDRNRNRDRNRDRDRKHDRDRDSRRERQSEVPTQEKSVDRAVSDESPRRDRRDRDRRRDNDDARGSFFADSRAEKNAPPMDQAAVSNKFFDEQRDLEVKPEFRTPVPDTPFAGIFDDTQFDFDLTSTAQNAKTPAARVPVNDREERQVESVRPQRDNRNRGQRDSRQRPENDNRQRDERPSREQDSRDNRQRDERPSREQVSRDNRQRDERPSRDRGARDNRQRDDRNNRPREDRRSAPTAEESRHVDAAVERQAVRKPERPQFSSWNETIETVVRFNMEKHATKKNNGGGNYNRRK